MSGSIFDRKNHKINLKEKSFNQRENKGCKRLLQKFINW